MKRSYRRTATSACPYEVSSLSEAWGFRCHVELATADNTQLVEASHLLKADTMEGIEGHDKGTLDACYIACQPMGG